jgi:DNA-binding MarR family transcriptional regulator
MLASSVVTETNQDPGRAEAGPILAWVERIAAFFEANYAMPPITGRILGWLLICDPAEQSAAEIAAAIRASRASLTTNLRALTADGLVKRSRRAGERTATYRVDDAAWEALIRRRVAGLAAIEPLTQDGMRLAGRSAARGARLRAVHEVFAWFEALLADAPGPPSKAGA